MSSATELRELRNEVRHLREQLASALVPRRVTLTARSQMPEHREHPDPTPLEVPVGMNLPPTLTELVKQHVEGAVSQWAQEHKLGTFEEEDDFEPEDEDLLPLSGYEVTEYQMVEDAPTLPTDPPANAAQEATQEADALAELKKSIPVDQADTSPPSRHESGVVTPATGGSPEASTAPQTPQ